MAIPFLSTFTLLAKEDELLDLVLKIQKDLKIGIINKNEINSVLSEYKLKNRGDIYKFSEIIENLMLYRGDFLKINIYKNYLFRFVVWEINSQLYITGCRTSDFCKTNGKLIDHFKSKSKKKYQVYFFVKKFRIDIDLMLLYYYSCQTFYRIVREYLERNIKKNKGLLNNITFSGYGPDGCFFQLLALDLKMYSSVPFNISFYGFEVPRKYDKTFELEFRRNIINSYLIYTSEDYNNKSCLSIQYLISKYVYKPGCFLFWRFSKEKEKTDRYTIQEFAHYFKLRTFSLQNKDFFSRFSPPTHMKITKKNKIKDNNHENLIGDKI